MSWQSPWAGGDRPNPPGGSPPDGPQGPPAVGPYPPGFAPTARPNPPPAPPSSREERAAKALRALPPPPGPPPGMGAIPAFTPPVPRRDHTVLLVTLTLGVSLLLCCVLVTAGFGGLVYSAYRTMQNDAVRTVDTYLGDLHNGQYTAAYGRLCSEAKAGRSIDDFAQAQQAAGQVTEYRVGSEIKVDNDGDWVVTAEVLRSGHAERAEEFPVVFDNSNTPLVCPL